MEVEENDMGKKIVRINKIIDFIFCEHKFKNNNELLIQTNRLITSHNNLISKENRSHLQKDKIKIINNESEMSIWQKVKTDIVQKLEGTEYEKLLYKKYNRKQSYISTSLDMNMSTSRYYELLNKFYSMVMLEIYANNLMDMSQKEDEPIVNNNFIKKLSNRDEFKWIKFIGSISFKNTFGESENGYNFICEKDSGLIIDCNHMKIDVSIKRQEG